MRIFVFFLILFSYVILNPLVKKNFLYSESFPCKNINKDKDKNCRNPDFMTSRGENYRNEKVVKHKVLKGESISTIAMKYNISESELRRWNDLEDGQKINTGQKLIVQKKNKKNALKFNQKISLQRPVKHWKIIKEYISHGDNKNLGILCKIEGKNNIKPATSGIIVKISHLRGYGKYILIDHGNGWHSMYSNINDVKVKFGQHVSLSETIANAKDNKLFFLLAYNGKPVNPVGYFNTAERIQ